MSATTFMGWDDERLNEVAELRSSKVLIGDLLIQSESPRQVASTGLTVEGLDEIGMFLDFALATRQPALD
jgi:hypothetical protein